jgi:hypothetical protein
MAMIDICCGTCEYFRPGGIADGVEAPWALGDPGYCCFSPPSSTGWAISGDEDRCSRWREHPASRFLRARTAEDSAERETVERLFAAAHAPPTDALDDDVPW